MSDYSQTTDFSAKDALATGNPNKLILGSDVDTELANIETAIGTKANKVTSPTSGNILKVDANGDLVDSGVALGSITSSELAVLDASAQAVTGFTYSNLYYIDDEGDSQGDNVFDVDSVIGASFESIGPTGGGATNTWTALDALPSTTKYIEVQVIMNARVSYGAIDAVLLYARKNGSSLTQGNGSLVGRAGGGTSETGATHIDFYTECTAKIPVSSRLFDLYLSIGGNVISQDVKLRLMGFGV